MPPAAGPQAQHVPAANAGAEPARRIDGRQRVSQLLVARGRQFTRLLFDLQVLAYQADVTRVITFMLGREFSGLSYPHIGVYASHHAESHHAGMASKLANLTKINTYHVALLEYYLSKLAATPDGDGSLLDHMVLLYGGGISNSDRHTHGPLPTLVLGGGAGSIKGGRHLVYPEGTPLTNLQLTLLHKIGVPVDRPGDSTGQFTELSEL